MATHFENSVPNSKTRECVGGRYMAWVIRIGIFSFLLFCFPKQMLTFIGGLLLVAGAILAWVWYDDYQSQLARKSLKTEAKYLGYSCKDPKAVGVMFWNQGKRTVKGIYFRLEAYRQGFSRPVLEDSKSTDLIVEPGAAYVLCWEAPLRFGQALPSDIGEFSWSAPVSWVKVAE